MDKCQLRFALTLRLASIACLRNTFAFSGSFRRCLAKPHAPRSVRRSSATIHAMHRLNYFYDSVPKSVLANVADALGGMWCSVITSTMVGRLLSFRAVIPKTKTLIVPEIKNVLAEAARCGSGNRTPSDIQVGSEQATKEGGGRADDDSGEVTARADRRRFVKFHPKAIRDLGNASFKTYAALCEHRNNRTGLAYPSTQTLADAVGKDVRAIQKDLKEIVARGYAVPRGWTRHGVRKFFIPLNED